MGIEFSLFLIFSIGNGISVAAAEELTSWDQTAVLSGAGEVTQRLHELGQEDCPDVVISPKTGCKFDRNSRILHFPQMHWRPEFRDNPLAIDQVARSQFDLAHFLVENPEYVVFKEGLFEDIGPKAYADQEKDPRSLVLVARMIFPRGIPNKFDELSNLQKEFLAEIGAGLTLFYLGTIKEIHRTITPDESHRIDGAIEKKASELGGLSSSILAQHPEISRLIFHDREMAASQEVKSFLEKKNTDSKAKVLLVFGSAHDFSAYFTHYSFSVSRSCGLSGGSAKVDFPGFGRGKNHPMKKVPNLINRNDQQLRPYSSFNGDWREALLYYGNFRTENRHQLEEQETLILDQLRRSGQKIAVWDWQHFVTPELKRKALEFLDPKSFYKEFPVSSFKQIISKDPALQKAGETWMRENLQWYERWW